MEAYDWRWRSAASWPTPIPLPPQPQSDLAASYNNIGLLLNATGKPDDALEALESSIKIWQKLVDANPTNTQFQSDLAAGQNNIGLLLRGHRKPAEALKAHESALAIQQKLADANPTVIQFQSELATSSRQHRQSCSARPKVNSAKAIGARTSRRWRFREKVADANPKATMFQADLASSHNAIGTLLRDTGKPDEALRAIRVGVWCIRQKLAGRQSHRYRVSGRPGGQPHQHRHPIESHRQASRGIEGHESGPHDPTRNWRRTIPSRPNSRAISAEL